MRREELSDKEYLQYIDDCETGKLDKYIYTLKDFNIIRKSSGEKKLEVYDLCRKTWLNSNCNRCGDVTSVVIHTGNVHRLKTICALCFNYIKFGYPQKAIKKEWSKWVP